MTDYLNFFNKKTISSQGVDYLSNGKWKKASAVNYYTTTIILSSFTICITELALQQFYYGALELLATTYFVLALYLSKKGYYFLSVNMSFIGTDLVLLFFDSFLGPHAGISFYFFPLFISIPFIIGMDNKKLIYVHLLLAVGTWAFVQLTSHSLFVDKSLTKDQLRIIYFFNMVMTIFSTGFFVYFTFKYAEENVFASERIKLKAVIDSNHQLIMVVDEKWNVEICNEKFAKHHLKLYNKHVIINTPFLQYFDVQYSEMLTKYLERGFKGEHITEDKQITILGKLYYYNFSVSPVQIKDGEIKSVVFCALDISGAKLAEKKLEDQNKALEKSNSQLDQFIYRATHDLRSPLSSIKGLVNLTEEEINEEMQMKYLNMIRKSIDRMDHSITTIIDYSKNTKEQLNIVPIDLEKFMNELIESVKYSENAKNIDFQCNVYQINSFNNDIERLNAVMGNLISNAISYRSTHKRSFVNIEAMVFEERAIISVKDNGVGIGDEHKNNIFDMFYRASTKSGSGLGLYIVKEVMNAIGGSINLETSLGSGTTFKLDIPNLKAEDKHKKRNKSSKP